jgi:hypothetical protein
MLRVPNPPKLPVIFAVETRTREKRAARPVVSRTSNMPRPWAAIFFVLSTAASMARPIQATALTASATHETAAVPAADCRLLARHDATTFIRFLDYPIPGRCG